MHNKITPLYILAKRKELGKIQVMDIDTINWIESNLNIKYSKIKKFVSKISPMKIDKFIDVMPKLEWFHGRSHFDSIHGFNHLSRVIIYAHILNLIKNKNDCEKYLIAAGMHDVCRLNDKKDINHGIRSAKWILKNGEKFGLNKKNREEIFYMVKYHNIELDKIPENIKDKFAQSILFLKTIDALDRYRLPKRSWWIDEKMLSLKLPEGILNFAKNLVVETEKATIQENQSREEVFIAVCQKLGLME